MLCLHLVNKLVQTVFWFVFDRNRQVSPDIAILAHLTGGPAGWHCNRPGPASDSSSHSQMHILLVSGMLQLYNGSTPLTEIAIPICCLRTSATWLKMHGEFPIKTWVGAETTVQDAGNYHSLSRLILSQVRMRRQMCASPASQAPPLRIPWFATHLLCSSHSGHRPPP